MRIRFDSVRVGLAKANSVRENWKGTPISPGGSSVLYCREPRYGPCTKGSLGQVP